MQKNLLSLQSTSRNSYKPTTITSEPSSTQRNQNVDTNPRTRLTIRLGHFGAKTGCKVVGARKLKPKRLETPRTQEKMLQCNKLRKVFNINADKGLDESSRQSDREIELTKR
ncbi:hypothetical protein Tco_0020223 [Tanacetum coccineum]